MEKISIDREYTRRVLEIGRKEHKRFKTKRFIFNRNLRQKIVFALFVLLLIVVSVILLFKFIFAR